MVFSEDLYGFLITRVNLGVASDPERGEGQHFQNKMPVNKTKV